MMVIRIKRSWSPISPAVMPAGTARHQSARRSFALPRACRGGLWEQLIAEHRQEQHDKSEKAEVRADRREREVLLDAHDDADGNSDKVDCGPGPQGSVEIIGCTPAGGMVSSAGACFSDSNDPRPGLA